MVLLCPLHLSITIFVVTKCYLLLVSYIDDLMVENFLFIIIIIYILECVTLQKDGPAKSVLY